MNWFQRAALAINPKAIQVLESTAAENRELRETISELQLDMEDQGYRLMVARSQTEFTRLGLDLIIQACRLFFLKNPIIRRGVKVSSYYVFGRGVDISSDDDVANETLQSFFTDPRNACELGQVAFSEANDTLQTDGNLFYVMFPNPSDGTVQVRSIDALEVREIICDPDDASVVWYYKRAWTHAEFDLPLGTINPEQKFCYYPALGYEPQNKPPVIGGYPVMWDNPVLHHKEGGLKKWKFGCPPVYSALDWTKAYRKLLTDYCQKAENLARFGWKATTKGGQKSVDQVTGRLQSTYAQSPGFGERNPAPQTGSAFVSGEGINLEALKIGGANSNPEEGRRVAHMAYLPFDLDERFFGDVAVGSLATGTSMDRPTELAFRSKQEAWEDVLTRMARYVLGVSKRAPSGRIHEANTVDPARVNVTVSFPAIIQQDPDKASDAIVKAFTGGTKTGTNIGLVDPKTLTLMILNLLGVDDAQEKADLIYPQATYDPADYAAIPAAQAAQASAAPQPVAQPPGRSSSNPQAA